MGLAGKKIAILMESDYYEPETFTAIKKALGHARNPCHYLAVPPSLFPRVIAELGAAGLQKAWRRFHEKVVAGNKRALSRFRDSFMRW